MLAEVAMMDGNTDRKLVKYGALGSRLRRKVDECVQELFFLNFPVEPKKRKRALNC